MILWCRASIFICNEILWKQSQFLTYQSGHSCSIENILLGWVNIRRWKLSDALDSQQLEKILIPNNSSKNQDYHKFRGIEFPDVLVERTNLSTSTRHEVRTLRSLLWGWVLCNRIVFRDNPCFLKSNCQRRPLCLVSFLSRRELFMSECKSRVCPVSRGSTAFLKNGLIISVLILFSLFANL